MRKITFSAQASAELEAAAFWYEEQSRGLGSEFIRSVDVALAKIGRTPTLYSIAFDDTRRSLLKKFPFGIFFSIEQNDIVVVSIFHSRRDLRRLRKT